MAIEYTRFYYVPKESIMNMLNMRSEFTEGKIICKYGEYDYNAVKITLSNYRIHNPIVVRNQNRRYNGGLMGTKLVLRDGNEIYESENFQKAKQIINSKLKQFEI